MLQFKISQIKRALLTSLVPLSLAYSMPALAGMDVDCSPNFDLSDSRSYNECSNLPVLIPGNDNKTNALLLLTDLGLAQLQTETQIDKDLWSAFYAYVPFEADHFIARGRNKVANQRKTTNKMTGYVYDERCLNLTEAAKQFNAQVQQHNKLSGVEKQLLIQARGQINSCDDKQQFIAVDTHWSQTAQQYASYLNGSVAFYNANFSAATKIYTVLSQVDDAWLKETSQYMLIRSSLNAAFATGVDQYGDVEINKIDQQLLQSVKDHIQSYLKLYPQGQYVASAQGLLRRYYWLAGRQDLLIKEISWQMQNSQSPRYNLDMAALPAEIDRRIFQSSAFNPQHLNDPFFLAIYDLMQMRNSNDPAFKPLSWSALNAQKAQFKTQPELFEYLQASHLFYVQNKATEALNYLPNQSTGLGSYLQLSQAFLKGQILEKTAPNQATAYWAQLLKQSKNQDQRGLFEVALAQHFNQQQNYPAFISKQAQISQLNLQRNFLLYYANEQSLEKIIQAPEAEATQKQTALFVLLAKSLGYQNYALFNRYYGQMPKDANQYLGWESKSEKYQNLPPFAQLIWNGNTISPQLSCPSLPNLTQALEKSPQELTLRVCLGEYMRSERSYGVLQLLDFESPTSLSFKGKVFTRGQAYKDVINRKQKSELTAYALYRSIQCYAPSGYNDCQDAEVPKSTRKHWFDQLKRDYPQSSWAKSLKYYW